MSFKQSIVRRRSNVVRVGNIEIGGDSPISIQSMTNTRTNDVESTIDQIKRLADAGCEIVRVAVPDVEAARALKDIKKRSAVPIVADIHFDHKLALMSIEAGVDKLRINPGNIGSKDKIAEVVRSAKERGIPIRIGVNGGSLEKDILAKYGHPVPEALVESAIRHISILEDLDFHNIVVALKTSDVLATLKAYQLLSNKTAHPFHIGITESGTVFSGTVKSSIGVGSLLINGLGDTMRISLTGDPVNEIRVAKEILKCLGLRKFGPKIISCPTCGRCNIDLERIALEVEAFSQLSDKDVTIAVMGCAVNGPGEAKEADFGIAGGIGEAILFRKGEIITKLPYDRIIEALKEELDRV